MSKSAKAAQLKLRKGHLHFNRLVKTNGRYSKGKLAIVLVSFVAIGTIIVYSTNAASITWSVYQTWRYSSYDPSAPAWNWHDSGWEAVNFAGLSEVWVSNNPNGWMWYGPFVNIYNGAPSTIQYNFCAILATAGSSSYYRESITSNWGTVALSPSTGSIDPKTPITGVTTICQPVWLGKGVYTAVENRFAYRGGDPLVVYETWIDKIGG